MSKKISNVRPSDIIDIKSIIPDIKVKINYATTDNFTGKIIPGYNSQTAFLTTDATLALKEIQEQLKEESLSLYIYDAYRPHKSVLYFCNEWVSSQENLELKNLFYPNKTKNQVLFVL